MIKRLAIALIVSVAIALAADVAGPWQGTMTGGGGTAYTYVILKTAGGQLTGTYGPDKSQQMPIENGKLAGNKVSFRSTMQFPGQTVTFDYDLTVDGDAMHGTFTVNNGKEKHTGQAEFKRPQ